MNTQNPLETYFYHKTYKVFHNSFFLNFFRIPHAINLLSRLSHKSGGKEIISYLGRVTQFSYLYKDSHYIPHSWPLVVIANHPYSLLDQYSIASVLEEMRPDSKIKIITENVFQGYEIDYPLSCNIWISWEEKIKFRDNINTFLKTWGTIIIFPWAQVTHKHFISWKIVEGKWSSGALHFAKTVECPILPVYVKGNTSFFYNFFSNIFPRKVMKNFNIRQAFRKDVHLDILFWEAIHDLQDISPECLKKIIYSLSGEKYIPSKI